MKGDARNLDYYSFYVVDVVPFGLEYYSPLPKHRQSKKEVHRSPQVKMKGNRNAAYIHRPWGQCRHLHFRGV